MKKLLFIPAIIALSACGTEVVYVTSTEAPVEEITETTVKRTTTTQPKATRPPSNVPSSSSIYDPEGYDAFLWESVNDFWWLFTTEDLLQMGLLVCESFDAGATLDEVTLELINAMANTNTVHLAEGMAAVTAGALTYLCPEHGWWLSTI